MLVAYAMGVGVGVVEDEGCGGGPSLFKREINNAKESSPTLEYRGRRLDVFRTSSLDHRRLRE